MTSFHRPPRRAGFGGLAGSRPRGHGQRWPESNRRYNQTGEISGDTHNDEWIRVHFLWDVRITYRTVGPDGEFRYIKTRQNFSVFRQLPERFPEHKQILRVITAESVEAIDFENIGMHWSWAPPWRHAWARDDEPPFVRGIRASRKPIFLLAARIAKGDVDWPETMIQNLALKFGEREIAPRIGSRLRITRVRRLQVDGGARGELRPAERLDDYPEWASVSC